MEYSGQSTAFGVEQEPSAPQILTAAPGVGAISVSWARHQDEVRAAQRLRFDVFAVEMGARLTTPLAGHDIDLFDNYCEHLLVRDSADPDVRHLLGLAQAQGVAVSAAAGMPFRAAALIRSQPRGAARRSNEP